jgi:hypothetical protein
LVRSERTLNVNECIACYRQARLNFRIADNRKLRHVSYEMSVPHDHLPDRKL